MTESVACLTGQNLSQSFQDGHTVIDVFQSINLSVAKGESVAIVGASGSGKSTLLHILGGLAQPSSGQVYWAQQPIGQLKDKQCAQLRNHYLGFIYQFHHLLAEFSAVENVAMPLLLRGEHKQQAHQQARSYLDKVGLNDRYQHHPAQLSGGERQRVAIARALVTQPHCILADEPTGNLDDRTSAAIIEVLLDLQTSQNTALVMVTHHQGIAHQAQRCLSLHEGQLLNQSYG